MSEGLLSDAPQSHVLIIAPRQKTRRQVEESLPDAIPRRSVGSAPDTEGIGSQVVVVAGDDPLVELMEVRSHPRLHALPVVLFAPGRDLPVMDWQSARVWPVTKEHNAMGQLVWHVRRLLSHPGRGIAEAGAALL